MKKEASWVGKIIHFFARNWRSIQHQFTYLPIYIIQIRKAKGHVVILVVRYNLINDDTPKQEFERWMKRRLSFHNKLMMVASLFEQDFQTLKLCWSFFLLFLSLSLEWHYKMVRCSKIARIKSKEMESGNYFRFHYEKRKNFSGHRKLKFTRRAHDY